jgi:hypothetical protein
MFKIALIETKKLGNMSILAILLTKSRAILSILIDGLIYAKVLPS